VHLIQGSVMRRKAMLAFCCLCLAAGLDPAAEQRPDLLGKLKAKRTILVFGQQIAYYEAGRGKTVVLLPNLTWDSHAWSENRDHQPSGLRRT
jgi:hypothetical protein